MGEKGLGPEKIYFTIRSITDMYGEHLYSGAEETLINNVNAYCIPDSP